MAESAKCPECGQEIPPLAPAGMCPKCLMRAGLEGQSPMPPTSAQGAFTPPDVDELAHLFSQLEMLELLGRGGMGAVYKARQRELDRLVAVKILPAEISSDPAFAERFTREARALARLSHQNIVSVYDFGRRNGLYYFIMEYVDGANLRELLRSRQLSPEQALAIVPQICEALQFAHDEGIVHRDIKPENILLAKTGRVKIADFGLAKLLGHAPLVQTLTGTHQVMGTLYYMAPEQAEQTYAVDHRADIYSLGVVFYEMLTGELPVGHFAPPSQKALVDARLDEVVLRALAKEPDRRYQHASDVKSDVEHVVSGVDLPAASRPPRNAHVAAAGHVADSAGYPMPTPPAKPDIAKPLRHRFSRTAVLGACWAPFFFLAGLLFLIPVRTESTPARVSTTIEELPSSSRSIRVERRVWSSNQSPAVPRPTVWRWALLLTVAPLGLTAPFGTTILGLIAISRIRHAEGRIIGLPLAVADALLFPLLLIDVLIFVVMAIGISTITLVIIRSLGHQGMNVVGPMSITLLLFVPVCLVVDVLVVRAVWRKATTS